MMLAVFIAAIPSAVADDRSVCADTAAAAESRIAACTRTVETGALRGRTLADVFNDRGGAWLRMGDSDRAIADYGEAIRLDSQNAATFNNRGGVLLRKGDYDRAIADYSEAIRIDPNYASAFHNRGDAWLRKGDRDRALADYSEAIRIDPTYASAYNNRGSVWKARGDLDRAIADYSEAIRLNPQLALAFFNRGDAWDDKGESDRAVADLTEAIRLDRFDVFAYNIRGTVWIKQGNLDRAIADFSDVIRLNPRYPLAYANRGEAWSERGELDRAIEDFNEAIRLDPKYGRAYRLRGIVWQRKENLDRAIEDFGQAIKFNERDADAFFRRGSAWLLRPEKDYDKAIADFDQAIRLEDKHAKAYFSRGEIWLLKNQFDRAIEDFNAVINLDPKDNFAFNNRGNAWFAKKEYDRAISDYTDAIKLNTKYAVAYTNRGNAWREKGEYESALEDFKEAINLNPTNADAHRGRALTLDLIANNQRARDPSGSANISNNRPQIKNSLDLAIQDLTKAIELDPKDAVSYNNRGILYQKKLEFDLAIVDHDKAIALVPTFGKAFLYRGKAWLGKGNADRAIKEYDQALRLSPHSSDALIGRCLARLLKEDLNGAISECSSAVEADRRSADAYYARCLVLIVRSDPQGAMADCNEAIKIDPMRRATAGEYRALALDMEKLQLRRDDLRAMEKSNPEYFDVTDEVQSLDQSIKRRVARLQAQLMPRPDAPAPSASIANQTRVALVIGNRDYSQLPKLGNPVTDAGRVASALLEIGFKVVTLESNLSISQFIRALKEYKKVATGAEMAIFYYAGHAVQASGVNYLIPVDADDLDEEVDLKKKTVALDDVLNIMGEVQKLRVVILDAPRGLLSVGAARGGPRGLAPADALLRNDATTYVIYGAQAGTTAEDGLPGGSSPFTRALLRHLSKPGLPIANLLAQVQEDLMTLAVNQQLAFYAGGQKLGENYYFSSVGVAEPQPKPIRLASINDESSEEETWKILRTKNDADGFRNYMRTYPNSRHFEEAAIGFAAIITARSGQSERGLALTAGRDRNPGQREIVALMNRGKSYALIVGNQNYKDRSFSGLITPHADARAVEEILVRQYGFTTRLKMDDSSERSLVLLDASRDEISDVLEVLARTLTSDDRLLVYYAGHGMYEERTQEAYWVPVNAQRNHMYDLIPASDLTRALRRVIARSVLIVADSCYSGALTRDSPGGQPPTHEERERSLIKLAEQLSRVVITSGGNEPVLDGGGSGHSIFARKFIEALKSSNQAIFSAQELYVSYLLPSVSGNAAQQPTYGPLRQSGHDTGDFIFVQIASSQANDPK